MAAMVSMSSLLNGKDSRWLQLEVCREFQRNKCSRPDTECKFAHPPANVEVQNGRVTACYDSIKVSFCVNLIKSSRRGRFSFVSFYEIVQKDVKHKLNWKLSSCLRVLWWNWMSREKWVESCELKNQTSGPRAYVILSRVLPSTCAILSATKN